VHRRLDDPVGDVDQLDGGRDAAQEPHLGGVDLAPRHRVTGSYERGGLTE
jgi:hypothetical protein